MLLKINQANNHQSKKTSRLWLLSHHHQRKCSTYSSQGNRVRFTKLSSIKLNVAMSKKLFAWSESLPLMWNSSSTSLKISVKHRFSTLASFRIKTSHSRWSKYWSNWVWTQSRRIPSSRPLFSTPREKVIPKRSISYATNVATQWTDRTSTGRHAFTMQREKATFALFSNWLTWAQLLTTKTLRIRGRSTMQSTIIALRWSSF